MSTDRNAQLGIRARLLIVSVVLIAIGLAGANAFISRALDRDLGRRVLDDLATQALLIAQSITRARAYSSEAADAVARAAARETRARVTVIDARGAVVADSAVAANQLSALDNHDARPEVREARRAGRGFSTRTSGTLRVALSYVAVAFTGESGSQWILRVALAPRTLEPSREAIRRLLYVGAFLGLIAAAALSTIAVQLVARPVRELTSTARALVSDLSVRSRIRQGDEVGALADAINELADSLARSRDHLARERDHLGAILEAMVEGVLVIGPDGNVMIANRALREMFSVGPEVLGRPPADGLPSSELLELLEQAPRTQRPASGELSLPGARPRTLVARVAPLGEDNRGSVSVVSDVTELRRLDRVRRDFVANVSHELRTPIAAVSAAAETLQSGALGTPAAASEFVEIILRHVQRLHDLVEDLLELSRIEAKELRLEIEPRDLATDLARCVELFRLAAERKNIRIRIDPFAVGMRVLADRRAFERVISNLVDNAIKYAPEGSVVTLSARRRGATARISVADAGAGIEALHLPRLFERFYRVDAGRSRQLGGTGLGLAIVKHLTEAMAGSVSVESAVGKGTTFHVDMPAATAA